MTISPADLRAMWRADEEVALIDLREEADFAAGHPLFAVNVPLAEVEVALPRLVPRAGAPVVVYDDGEGFAEPGAARIRALGYTDVRVLEGGLAAYAVLGELHSGLNAPARSFGALLAAVAGTPVITPEALAARMAAGETLAIVDPRRFEHYAGVTIPGAHSLPGAELLWRISSVVADDTTPVIVAGGDSTRSLIGAQGLIAAGLPNPVLALQEGLAGWQLAGQNVERGAARRPPAPHVAAEALARERARSWSDRLGVEEIDSAGLAALIAGASSRSVHLLDVRDPREQAQNPFAGFTPAPGGQLIHGMEEWVGVRGAILVLADDDGVRARMTAGWLMQMGWDARVMAPGRAAAAAVPPRVPDWRPKLGAEDRISVDELDLALWTVADLARSPIFVRGHIPGAWHVSGPHLARDLAALPGRGPICLTSTNGRIAAANLAVARAATTREVRVLMGGTYAWRADGKKEATGPRFLRPPRDAAARMDGAAPLSALREDIAAGAGLLARLANDGVSRFRYRMLPGRAPATMADVPAEAFTNV